jgi:hypothetical protein
MRERSLNIMTDYKCKVSLEVADRICSQLTQAGYDVEVFEGVLLDSYFCEIGEDAKLKFTLKRGGSVKLRKYLMIIQNAKNEWSSDLTLVLTDDKEEYENELKKFKEVA